MINRDLIQVTLKDHNINAVFTRCTLDNYHSNYLSSFYIEKLKIKRSNVEFKEGAKNTIIKKLETCFENNEYSLLNDVTTTIKRTINYITILKGLIEDLPQQIMKGTDKYVSLVETHQIHGDFEISALRIIATHLITKVTESGYFEKTEYYKNVLLTIKAIIDEVRINKVTDIEKINLLKKTYENNEKYLKEYVADITPITNEIDAASQHMHELFKKIRALGLVTCSADLFIDNKKNNASNHLDHTITPIQDSKYKSLYMFKDNSLLFEDVDGGLLEVQDNDHLNKIQNEIVFDSIGVEFKKHPRIEKLFKSIIVNNPNYMNRIIGIAEQYKKYSDVLKDEDFIILDEIKDYKTYKSDYEHLEEVKNKIQKIAKTHNVKMFAYSIASKKYKNLYDTHVMQIMENLYDLKINNDILQEQIGSKIAAYHTPEEFYKGLKNLYNMLINHTKEQILEKVKALNTKITYENDDIIILEINSFNQSSQLGAASWCITRDEKYFKNYTKNESKQYVVYNFNDKTPTNETLIGITLIDNSIKAANYKNNDNIDRMNEYLMSMIDLIIKSECKEAA